MASVNLPGRLNGVGLGACSFLYLEVDEGDGSLSRSSTNDPSECMDKALGGLFLQECVYIDSEEAMAFKAALPAAFEERYGRLPEGVLLEPRLYGYQGEVHRIDLAIGYDDSPWSAKRFQSAIKAGSSAFKALRYFSCCINSAGLPRTPEDLIIPKGHTLKDGKLVRKDDRLSVQDINSARERLTHYLLSMFSYSSKWFAVARDAGRPVEETKALIDAARKAHPDSLYDLYRCQRYDCDIKALSRPDADKILKEKEHKEARKDLLEVLRYLRKKVPVSMRKAALVVAEDEEEG